MSQVSADVLHAVSDGMVTGPELRSGAMRLLAVDRTGIWAAAFRFRVYDDGDWVNDTILLRQLPDGTWEDMTSGGARGSGWRLPWVVPTDGWGGEMLSFVSCNSIVVEDRRGEEVELSAMSGFAAAGVATVRVTTRHGEHLAPVIPPANAIVALIVGTGHLVPLDDRGESLGPPRSVG